MAGGRGRPLKRCPFCWGEAVYVQIPGMKDTWAVGCDGDAGSLCPGYVFKAAPVYIGKRLAAEMWNRRAGETEAME